MTTKKKTSRTVLPNASRLARALRELAPRLQWLAQQLEAGVGEDSQRDTALKVCQAWHGTDAKMWLISDFEAGIAEQQELDECGSRVKVDFEAFVEQIAFVEVDSALIRRVVESSLRKRTARKRGTREYSKWEAYAALVEAAGFGRIESESLRVEYSKWRSRHFDLSEPIV